MPLKKKAQAASDDMKEEYQSQLKTLKKKRDEAEKQIETLQAATDSAWNDLKQGGEEAWHAISHALTSVKTRIFHKETTK